MKISNAKTKGEGIAIEQFGMTFRCEQGTWVSYPTNIDDRCDFDEFTAVPVEDWEQSSPEEIRQVLELLEEKDDEN